MVYICLVNDFKFNRLKKFSEKLYENNIAAYLNFRSIIQKHSKHCKTV